MAFMATAIKHPWALAEQQDILQTLQSTSDGKEFTRERERVRDWEAKRERKREREGDPVGKLFFPPPPPPSSPNSQHWLGAPAAVQDVIARLLMLKAAGQVLCTIQCLQEEQEAL